MKLKWILDAWAEETFGAVLRRFVATDGHFWESKGRARWTRLFGVDSVIWGAQTGLNIG